MATVPGQLMVTSIQSRNLHVLQQLFQQQAINLDERDEV